MKITPITIKVGELVDGYANQGEDGVVGYHGKLDIRPPYQREFVYSADKQRAVIQSILKGYPLNSMYWAKNGDRFELLDGQQRTMSICSFVTSVFPIDDESGMPTYYGNATADFQKKVMDYELMVYLCEGDEAERLEWFRVINTGGERLTDQELLNINYLGPWLQDAKRRFSKTDCVAYRIGDKFVRGAPIRQEYLETALKWISGGEPADYMARHQKDVNANELWLFFKNVIDWVVTTFAIDTNAKNYRREMLGLDWGSMYRRYKDNAYDASVVEKRVNELMANEEVTDKRGVYEYILSGEDVNIACRLSKRTFSSTDKRTAYERQKGICPVTGVYVPFEDMQADHIVPWWKGGTTTLDNLQMISKTANARKSGSTK